MMNARARELIETLGLERHPEGGYFREVFRSGKHLMLSDGRGARAALTTIYFLLTSDDQSRWHQVDSDEVWHLYEGGPLELLEMSPSGEHFTRHTLTRAGDGGAPVHTIPAQHWQAARPDLN